MIDRKNIAVLAACLLALGGGYWWLEGGSIQIPGLGDDRKAAVASAGTDAAPAAPASAGEADALYQKAILACLLAASYGAERGARIDQVETLTRDIGSDPSALSSEERRDFDALMAQLPEHRRERDASYALYFSGIEALAAAKAEQTAAAFDAISAELDRAGLQRLTRYVPAIRRHIDNQRSQPRDAARDQRWIEELKDAVRN